MEVTDFFPSYTAVSEGDNVELSSGKVFTYQVTSTGFPGRYRSVGLRTDLDAGGLLFDSIKPLRVNVDAGTETDPDTQETLETREVTYRIDVQTLEEVN